MYFNLINFFWPYEINVFISILLTEVFSLYNLQMEYDYLYLYIVIKVLFVPNINYYYKNTYIFNQYNDLHVT